MSFVYPAFLALLFIAVGGLVFGLFSLGQRDAPSGSRLSSALGEPSPAPGQVAVLTRLARAARPIARLALPESGWDSSALRLRFMHAGLRQPSVPVLYFAAKAGLALLLPFIALFALGLSSLHLSGDGLLFLILLSASLGYYLPNVLLALRIRTYQREILNAFPDAIDLVIVCIEAGLGLDAAIARCADELRLRSPQLAGELHLTTLELRVGASRDDALRNLALRTGLPEVASLVTMLRQASRFGTSIADSLRVHADSLRTRRQQRAEEAAARIPLKLLFPLIFCIFPSLLLVLLGPAGINIFRTFSKTITH